MNLHRRFVTHPFRYEVRTIADGKHFIVYGKRGEEAEAFSFLRATGIITDAAWERRNAPGYRIELEFNYGRRTDDEGSR